VVVQGEAAEVTPQVVHEGVASRVIAGVAGAVAMMAVIEAGAMAEGMALVRPLQVIGWTFVGPDGLGTVAVSAAFGAVIHLTVAVVLALIFTGIVGPDRERTSSIGVGVGFALFAVAIMMSLVVPWANPGFRGEMQAIGGTWVIAHAVFGAVLGLRPALGRSRASPRIGVRAAPDPDRSPSLTAPAPPAAPLRAAPARSGSER
jgi:hypothetical protein